MDPSIDRAIAKSIRQGGWADFWTKDQTFNVNKLFIICMAFCFVLVSPWALRENNALELANKSARCVGYKHNPNNKCVYSIYSTDI